MLALLGNNVLLLVTLQLLYLLKQLIEEEQGLRCKRLVEDLWVEVSSLHCHLDLLDKNFQHGRDCAPRQFHWASYCLVPCCERGL